MARRFAQSVFGGIFLPISLIVIVEQYILNQVYGMTIVVEGETITKPVADNWQILLIPIICIFGPV